MPEGGFFEQKRASPTSLAIVVILHGAAITALALSKMDVPGMKIFKPIQVEDITDQPAPPPMPEPEPVKPEQTQITRTEPLVSIPLETTVELTKPEIIVPVIPKPEPPVVVPLDPPPAPKPVLKEAQMDPRFADRLQPPYPAAEQREGREGKVTIRIVIGPDGRVKSAEKVFADTDGFYRATERQALGQWRFKPATLGGEPIESVKVVTVVFRIEN